MEVDASIIIPFHNEGINVYNTLKSIHENTSYENYEIIVVDDGSTDRDYSDLKNFNVRFYRTKRIGSSKARNYGAEHARGGFLVFLDAHTSFQPKWLSRLVDVMEEFKPSIVTPCIFDINIPQNKGYGFTFGSWKLNIKWLSKKGTKPYEIPMGSGACMVIPKKLFDSIGGFDHGIKEWGCEDVEICLRTWLLGYSVMLIPTIEVGHLFRSQFPYEIRDFIINRNILRLAFTHFKKERIKKVVECLKKYPGFYRAYLSNIFSDILIRRFSLMKKRKFDDDWFFEKFKINI